MAQVTHGADARRLRGIADALRGNGAQVQEIGDCLGPLAQSLSESWSGPDAASLIEDVQRLRPTVASVGSTLVAWAEELRAQADEQTSASGEVGAGGSGGGGVGPGNGPRPPDVVDKINDLGHKILGDGSAAPAKGMTNPLLAALDPGPRLGSPGEPKGGDPFDVLFGKRIPGFDGPEGSRSKSLGKGIAIEVSGSATREDAGLNDQGQHLETTTVTGQAEVSAEGGKRIGKAGLDAKGFAGTENTYSVTGVRGTDLTQANPFSPEDMPEGSSVRLGSSWYAGYELDAQLKNIVLDMGSTTGKEHYVEITRGEGDEVTVRVGNDRFDEANGGLGVGAGKASVTMDGGGTMRQGDASEVTFDLSTQEGKDAYDRFVLGGQAPAADAPGVVDAAKVEAFSGSKTGGMSAHWGDKSATMDWVGDDNFSGRTTTHADGHQTVEWSGQRNGTSAGGSMQLDQDGNVKPGSEEFRVRRTVVDPTSVHDFMEATHGDGREYSQPQNVVVSYTTEDLHEMRRQAAAWEAQELNAGSNLRGSAFKDRQDWTADEVLAHVDSSDEARDTFRPGMGFDNENLIRARTDDEILDAVANGDNIQLQRDVALSYRGTGEDPPPVGKVVISPAK